VAGQEERSLSSNRGVVHAQASAYDSAPSIRGSQSPLVRDRINKLKHHLDVYNKEIVLQSPKPKPSALKKPIIVKPPAPSLSTMDKLYLTFLYFSKNTKLQPQKNREMKLFSEIKQEDEMLTLQQYLQFCQQVIAKKLSLSK